MTYDESILKTHPVVAYFGLNATKATLHYQVMKRNPSLDTAEQIEAELLETILHDHDTFFQWVEDFMDGKFV